MKPNYKKYIRPSTSDISHWFCDISQLDPAHEEMTNYLLIPEAVKLVGPLTQQEVGWFSFSTAFVN